jgi:REP element-mobilizing transposase RayT
VWTTESRAPLILPRFEADLYRLIASKCGGMKGQCLAVNGMPDHVHVLTTMPTNIAIGDFVKGLKGSSSRFVHFESEVPFKWRRGYGIFTVSERNLDAAISYVERQKEHHQNGTAISRFERVFEENDTELTDDDR